MKKIKFGQSNESTFSPQDIDDLLGLPKGTIFLSKSKNVYTVSYPDNIKITEQQETEIEKMLPKVEK